MSDSGSHRSTLSAEYARHWYSVENVPGHGAFGINCLSDNHPGQPVAIKDFLPADLAYRTNDNTLQARSDKDVQHGG